MVGFDDVQKLHQETNLRAFAVYSKDDWSLRFYKREQIPNEEEVFEGREATHVYTGVEALEVKECEEIPWWKKRKEIRYVKVEDVIAPISTAYWFYGMYRCTNMNLTKLNTSKVTDMSGMFLRCEDLTSLDVSNFSMVNYDGMR